ncbi:hypothetical protein ABK040_003901 [Willaertia magna]
MVVTYKIDIDKLTKIMQGAALMGAGGGGGISIGAKLVQYMKDQGMIEKITLIDANEVPETYHGVVVADMGSPAKFNDSSNFGIATLAFSAIQNYVEKTGGSVDFVVPIEVGPINSLVPMIVSAVKGIPCLLSDGAGRAIPTLTLSTFSANNISCNPSFLTDNNNESLALMVDTPDKVESLARPIISSPEFNSVAGLALWYMTAQQMKQSIIPGGMLISLAVGYLCEQAQATQDPVTFMLNNLPHSKLLARGKYTQIQSTSGGFDLGRVEVNMGNGSKLIVYNQNENLFAFRSDSGAVVATAPECISFLRCSDGHPLTNADISNSDEELAVVLVPGPAQLIYNPSLVGIMQSITTGLGYGGNISPAFTEDERREYFDSLIGLGYKLLSA